MRQDQIARLEQLAEKLTDVFLVDADPASWTAAATVPADMSQSERGDAVWCRKMASATGSVLARALTVLEAARGNLPRNPEWVEQNFKAAEKAAAEAVQKAKDRVAAR